MKRLPVLALLLWVCTLFYVGIFLFVGGFLLVRLEVNRTSTCEDVLLQPAGSQADFCRDQPRYRKAVVLIIDALRADFARYNPSNLVPRPYENKLPVLEELMSSRPTHTRLFTFQADPPTTTMQRIKGFTTGSLPTFIDVGNNFASSAILEDNLIHQLGQAGKRVVFMGDDTWENLFPKKFHRSLPFPSFNVKDLHTVDNGILEHLNPTMKGDDWDVLIGHFLGVDHCGHRYGPDHPAMADKLTQMNSVIRSVVEQLQNDTLLVVMGDHGMTDTGDHGGESPKETEAALFLYSHSPLFPAPGSQVEPSVVPQTDLVPTLALLLGIPIPYSSVGQVLLPLFPSPGQAEGQGSGPDQAEALWINVKQVNRFLETYSSMAKDIPADRLSELQAAFARLSAAYLGAVQQGEQASPELLHSMQAYLSSVRDTCRASWARFHPLKMAAGVALLGAACLLCYVLSELSSAVLVEGAVRAPLVAGVCVGVCVAIAQLATQGHVEAPWCLAAAAVSSEILFLWRNRRRSPRSSSSSSSSQKGRPAPPRLLSAALVVLLLRCASLLSDSYVIAEGRVVTFLLFSFGLYVPLRLNWDGFLLPPPPPDSQKPPGALPMLPLPAWAVRREGVVLCLSLGVLIGSLYLTLSMHACREEQGAWCQPSAFLSPLARVQDGRLRNLHYLLSLVALVGWTYLLYRWLRHYGNLNSPGVAVLAARWLLPTVAVLTGLHWAVSATPEDGFRGLAELMRLAQSMLPRAAFAFLGLGVALLWLDPLTVFLKHRASGGPRAASLPPPSYRASTGISPQAELHHLIPQLYQRIRRSLEDGPEEGPDEDGRPAVEAYGLGTVYSAPLVLLCGLLGVGLLLLHSETMAPAFLLLLLEAAALLHIHAACSTLSGQQGDYSSFSVPWAPVVMWSLAASQFFHGTGHLPTFPSLQWGAAFVGFPEGHTGTLLPATLVTLNTFSSHILFAVACPLLLFWPLVCEVRFNKNGRTAGEESEEGVMEMRLRENPQQFSAALLQLAARYLFVNGAQVFASVCAAAILRRHLMVWQVFAPKLMFAASEFVVSSVFLLLGVALVLRVDVAVRGWFKRLLSEASR
ncbi:GPI ethanolamine phosphate transferase 3 isoform X2 [Clupea harengus]|uniref:GPI ethanolamine phosphate transferase 3, catalytic subunit n=1 Tax=Clupea harengus TaxID=7950 RepID=A0A6P3VH90_CLUHA|nr:GPI ethanolamine phosphate transferase 3 isoform X2 [Clupea harengus]